MYLEVNIRRVSDLKCHAVRYRAVYRDDFQMRLPLERVAGSVCFLRPRLEIPVGHLDLDSATGPPPS